jgi:hypothetical protein
MYVASQVPVLLLMRAYISDVQTASIFMTAVRSWTTQLPTHALFIENCQPGVVTINTRENSLHGHSIVFEHITTYSQHYLCRLE